jgi:hypothetical protein
MSGGANCLRNYIKKEEKGGEGRGEIKQEIIEYKRFREIKIKKRGD